MLTRPYRALHRARRRRGFALVAALAVLVVIFTLTIALNYLSSSARASYMLEESSSQADDAIRRAVFEVTSGTHFDTPSSSNLDVYLQPMNQWYLQSAVNAAGYTFQPDKMPEAAYANGTAGAPKDKNWWYFYTEYQPKSHRPDLNNFGRRRYSVAYSASFPYGAFAPGGKVTLDEALPWGDPPGNGKSLPAAPTLRDFVSGRPVWIGAGHDVKVGDSFPYGSAYTRDANASIQLKGDGALAFYGRLPYEGTAARGYLSSLTGELDNAFNTLSNAASNGTKTPFVNSPDPFTVKDLVMQLLGVGNGSWHDFLQAIYTPSVRNGTGFPLPAIPTVSIGVLYNELTFHMPFPPDQESFAGDQSTLDATRADASGYQQAMNDLDTQIQAANAKMQKDLQAAGGNVMDAQVQKDQQAIDNLKSQQKTIQDQYLNMEKKLQGSFDAMRQKAMALPLNTAGPATRTEDDKVDADGPAGFNYVALLKTVYDKAVTDFINDICPKESWLPPPFSYLKIIIQVVKGQEKQMFLDFIKPIVDKLDIGSNHVRLINFGHRDNKTDSTFTFQGADLNSFSSDATWTVPQGRTLRLRGNVNIHGDVWIQRGATMVVEGNLTVDKPQQGSGWRDSLFQPNGRVILEPGASLVVGGNLNVNGGDAQGDGGSLPLWGSVLVTGPLGKATPITSAILCKGYVRLAYGVHPAMSLDDLAGYLFSVGGNATLQGLYQDILQPLMSEVAPNLAKVLGPFHSRPPFIARYATTIGFIVVIPFPAPITYHNMDSTIFKVVSAIYANSLNVELGENLYTHADWWPFGDGAVPVLPRVDPTQLMAAVQSMASVTGGVQSLAKFARSQMQNALSDFVQNGVKQIVDSGLEAGLNAIVSAVGEVIEGAKQGAEAAETVIKPFIDLVVQKGLNSAFGKLGLESTGTTFVTALHNMVGQITNQVSDSFEKAMLRTAPGVLVYAGNRLDVGTAGPSPLAIGLFVARQDVNIQTERVVGAVYSTQGSITAHKLVYNPYFTHASLYVPQPGPDWTSFWLTAGVDFAYGSARDSHTALEIGDPIFHVESEGWTQQ